MSAPLPSSLTRHQIYVRARAALDAERNPAVRRAWACEYAGAYLEDKRLPRDFPLPEYHRLVVVLLLGATARA